MDVVVDAAAAGQGLDAGQGDGVARAQQRDLIEAGAAVSVGDGAALAGEIERLLVDSEYRRRLAEAAGRVTTAHRQVLDEVEARDPARRPRPRIGESARATSQELVVELDRTS